MLPFLGFKTQSGRLIYESYERHTSVLRLELVADGLQMTTSVAEGSIDKVDLRPIGSDHLATVLVSNIDNLPARFTLLISDCPSLTVSPSVHEFSLLEQ